MYFWNQAPYERPELDNHGDVYDQSHFEECLSHANDQPHLCTEGMLHAAMFEVDINGKFSR